MAYKLTDFEKIPSKINNLFDLIKEENPQLNMFQIIDTIIFELAIEITTYNYRKTLIYGCLLAKISNNFKGKHLTIMQNEATLDQITIDELTKYLLSSPKDFQKELVFYTRNFNLLDKDTPNSPNKKYVRNFLLSKITSLDGPTIQVPDTFELPYYKNLSKTYVNSYLKLTSRNRYSSEYISQLIIDQID